MSAPYLTKKKVAEIISNAPEGVDKKKLVESLANNYELEGFNAEFSAFEAVKNVPESLLEFGKSIYSAITSPIQTVDALSSVARGAIRQGSQYLLGTDVIEAANNSVPDEANTQLQQQGVNSEFDPEQDVAAFDGMVDYFADRYGSTDNLVNTIEKDPVGFLSDASMVLGGGAKLGTLGGKALGSQKTIDASAKVQRFARVLEPTAGIVESSRKLSRASGLDRVVREFTAGRMAKTIDSTPSDRMNLSSKANLIDESYSHYFEDIPGNPISYMNRWGIQGSLPSMFKQLQRVKVATMKQVDQMTDSVQGVFKPRDAKVLLNEIKSLYTKEYEDIVSGVDIDIKRTPLSAGLFDAQGNYVSPISANKLSEVEVPYQQVENIRIPKENLSTGTLETLREVNDLLQKTLNDGVSMSDLNRIKRLGDTVLNIYKQNGIAKETPRFQGLADAHKRVRKFIEAEVGNQLSVDIRKFNQQTQIAKGLEEIVKNRLKKGANRGFSSALDHNLLTMGLGAAVYTQDMGLAASALAGVGTLKALRTPKIQSYLTNRLYLMSEGDYQAILGGIDTGRKSKKLGSILRRERRKMQRLFPQIRITRDMIEQEINSQDNQEN